MDSKSIISNESLNESLNENILSNDPYVVTYNNILTHDECQHFIDISKNSLKRAVVCGENKSFVSNGRTGSNTWIKHDHDKITKKIAERIAKIVNMPLKNAESFQVIYYDTTQEYRQHYDSWEHNGSKKTHRYMKWGGARMKTALCYLNDVTKGGGTKMTKLDITIPAEKGKLLVFHNTVSEIDHTRHELSEHAGMPVEEGEKYAFNLWFRECDSKMLYKDFNPDYYITNDVVTEKNETEELISDINLNVDNLDRLYSSKDIFKISNYSTEETNMDIISKCNFNTSSRRNAWVKLSDMNDLVSKIEKTTNIDKKFFENINVVEYEENKIHNKHFNAYDLNSEKGKEYTAKLGQRIFTISLFLSDNLKVSFPSLEINYTFKSGDILIYNNVVDKNLNRDKDLERSIVSLSGTGYLANIYVRVKSKKKYFNLKIKREKILDKNLHKCNELIKKIILLKQNEDYRFGDIVFHKGWAPNYDQWRISQKHILENIEFNNTILKEYIEKNNNNNHVPSHEKIALIFSEIIKKKILEKEYLIPKNDELVIHLRAGDVIFQKRFLKKPYIELIQEYKNKFNINKVSFVTCFHYGNNKVYNNIYFQFNNEKHKKNIEKLRDLFLNVLEKFPFLNIDVISSKDIDKDFVYMCKAKHFIEDKGGISRLIKIINSHIKTNKINKNEIII